MTKSGKPLPKSTTPKAFDVFRPGKTQASPTSRPVIVGHSPTVQDSTVTDKPSRIVGEPEYNHIMDSNDKVEVAVPTKEDSTDLKSELDITSTPDETEQDAEPKETNPENEIPELSIETTDAHSSEEFYFQAEKTEAAVEAGEVAVNHDAVVAFHSPGKKKQGLKIFVAIVLIAIVCIAIADVLIDAGVIKTASNIPHTHFFNH